jgi:uroporphyrinogen-III synthase
MIELSPVDDPAARAEVARVLGRLETYHAIVFTSSNAVRFFARVHEDTRGRGVGIGPGTRMFCIGERTAEEALRAGYPVHLIASGRSDAETLLAELVPLLSNSGERVLIPRSRIAATKIADGLRASGVEVDSVAFYENRRPAIDVEDLRTRLGSGSLVALTFTSPSTVDNFLACLDAPSLAAARRCMIAAIGGTTAKRLAEVGLPADVVPARPDVTAMVEALAQAFADRTS